MVEYSIEVDSKALANNLLKWEREFPGFVQEIFDRWGNAITGLVGERVYQVLKKHTGLLGGSHHYVPTPDTLTIVNTARYATVHEFGYSGAVTVREHTRSVVFGKRVSPFTVGAYSRRVNIPARPWVKTTLSDFFAGNRANDMADALFDYKKRKAGFQ